MTGGASDRRACPRTRRKGPTARTAAATTAADHHPTFSYFLTVNPATLPPTRAPSATRSSAISSGRQSLLGSHGDPLSGSARSIEA